MQLLREHELDRLAILERVEELDPGTVDAPPVLEAQRPVDGATLVPPVAGYDHRGERLAKPREHRMHDVQIVHHAAQEALAERPDHILSARADGLLDLLCLP